MIVTRCRCASTARNSVRRRSRFRREREGDGQSGDHPVQHRRAKRGIPAVLTEASRVSQLCPRKNGHAGSRHDARRPRTHEPSSRQPRPATRAPTGRRARDRRRSRRRRVRPQPSTAPRRRAATRVVVPAQRASSTSTAGSLTELYKQDAPGVVDITCPAAFELGRLVRWVPLRQPRRIAEGRSRGNRLRDRHRRATSSPPTTSSAVPPRSRSRSRTARPRTRRSSAATARPTRP